MKQLRGLDLKRAQLVPTSVFSSPEDVVRHDGLSTVQKLAILRRWEFDARRTGGYAGAPDMGMLFRVRRALQSLSCGSARGWDESMTGERVRTLPVADDGPVVVASSVLARGTATGKH